MADRPTFSPASRGYWMWFDVDVVVTEAEMRATVGNASLVATFGGDGLPRVSLHGLERASRADVNRLIGFLPSFRAAAKGRPPGTGYFRTEDELRDAIRKKAAELRRDRTRVTQKIVADRLGVSPKSLQRALRWFGLAWAEASRAE